MLQGLARDKDTGLVLDRLRDGLGIFDHRWIRFDTIDRGCSEPVS
ncbi:hypothetical protein [Candidatus Poriferisodalis sp.]